MFLGACYGGSFARAIKTIDRAPVLGLVGPTREITNTGLEADFKAFYQAFFEKGSLKAAIDALTERAGQDVYYRRTAEAFFYDVWVNYKLQYCTSEAARRRSRRMRQQIKGQGGARVPGLASIERLMQSKEREQFERFRDSFFMNDLDGGHRKRFPVSYEEAERIANQLRKRAATRGA